MVHEHEIHALAEAEWQAVGAALGLPAFTSRAAAARPGEARRASATATGTPYVRTEANGAAYDSDVAAAFSALWVRRVALVVASVFFFFSLLSLPSHSRSRRHSPSRGAAASIFPRASKRSRLLTLRLASLALRPPPSLSLSLSPLAGLNDRARRRWPLHRRRAPNPAPGERGHQTARRGRGPSLCSSVRARRRPRFRRPRSGRHADRAAA